MQAFGIGIASEYQRAALRFFDADDTTLSFDVTCPNMGVLFPHYTRSYSASGDDLWLFQQSQLDAYKKRP